MKLDDEEPRGDRVKEKGLKREGEVSDREKAKCVWESFGAEVHCGRADSVSGGSEVWINASDWRRAAAVVREQNIRRREKRGEKMEGVQTQNFGKGDILRSCCMKESASKVEQRCKTAYLQNPNLHGIEAISSCVTLHLEVCAELLQSAVLKVQGTETRAWVHQVRFRQNP